jgi:8-oxo-dGTP pyrophosphatase MutT (NUDIX family)
VVTGETEPLVGRLALGAASTALGAARVPYHRGRDANEQGRSVARRGGIGMAMDSSTQPAPATTGSRPRCLAVGVLRRDDGAVLLQTGYDPVKGEHFYRALGGGIEVGEPSRDAFAREIREELGAEVSEARLLGWVENIFTFEGRPGHEIVAVYEAALADRALYERDEIELADQLRPSKAVWVRLDHDAIVYPSGVRDLIG